MIIEDCNEYYKLILETEHDVDRASKAFFNQTTLYKTLEDYYNDLLDLFKNDKKEYHFYKHDDRTVALFGFLREQKLKRILNA